MAEPKILIYDIETSHNIVAQFSLDDKYTYPSNILQERFIICAAWQWLGEKKVHTVSGLDDPKRFAKDPFDDYHVVKTLRDVMSEADVIVAHYGDSFDNKWVATRTLYHGLAPAPPCATIDTKKFASSKFYFNSNKLDYIGKFLKLGRKKSTAPGLWLRVLRGDKQAIRDMVEYNKGDVTLLRDVFLKMRPFLPSTVSRELTGGTGCPRCGSKKIQSRGIHKAITKTYRRFQCQSCGGWFRLLKADKDSSTKHRII